MTISEQYAAKLGELNDELEAEVRELRDEVERLKADHLNALQISHEWMAKHDRLLAFIQARPEMLTELIAEEPEPSTERLLQCQEALGQLQEARAEIERLKAALDFMETRAVRREAEIERLRAESEAFRGKLAEQCGQTLVARAEIERLKAAISYVRMRSAFACEVLNEFDNTRAALEPKP